MKIIPSFANIVQTLSFVRNNFGSLDSELHSGGIIAYYPNDPDNHCEDFAGYTFGYNEFCMSNGFGSSNHIVGHEMGHIVHRRFMNAATSGGCPASYDWSDSVGQKCATSEGWADFVSLSSHWAPNSSAPFYRSPFRLAEGDIELGNGGYSYPCVSYDSLPYSRRGNVVRFFWDLYDSTSNGSSDSANDDNNRFTSTIRNIWLEFPSGTSNHQASESGTNGRNVKDYVYYDYPYDFYSEEISNCLGDQDN